MIFFYTGGDTVTGTDILHFRLLETPLETNPGYATVSDAVSAIVLCVFRV